MRRTKHICKCYAERSCTCVNWLANAPPNHDETQHNLCNNIVFFCVPSVLLLPWQEPPFNGRGFDGGAHGTARRVCTGHRAAFPTAFPFFFLFFSSFFFPPLTCCGLASVCSFAIGLIIRVSVIKAAARHQTSHRVSTCRLALRSARSGRFDRNMSVRTQ